MGIHRCGAGIALFWALKSRNFSVWEQEWGGMFPIGYRGNTHAPWIPRL